MTAARGIIAIVSFGILVSILGLFAGTKMDPVSQAQYTSVRLLPVPADPKAPCNAVGIAIAPNVLYVCNGSKWANVPSLGSDNSWTGQNIWTGTGDFTASPGVSLPPPWISRDIANSYSAGATQTFSPNSTKGGIRLVGSPRPTSPDPGTLNLSVGGGQLEWFDGQNWRVAAVAATEAP